MGQCYAFVGDVPAPGTTPPIIQVTDTVFDAAGPHRVNTHPTLAAAWAANGPADPYLARPANDPDAEEVTVRNIAPIPHEHVPAILAAHGTGTLTHAWLYHNVLVPLMADPAQVGAYTNFTNWIRVAGTLDVGNDPSPVELVYQAICGLPQVSAQAPTVLAQHLPGLLRPTSIHGTLAQMTQHHQQMVTQMTQATAQAGQPRIKALQETNPHLHAHVLRLC